KIINFLGSPGAGKSSLSALLFTELKFRNINCELVTEFAKDLVWSQRKNDFQYQLYIFAKQLYRIERLVDKVDYIVTDSPLLLSLFYHDGRYTNLFDKLVLEIFYSFDNINYYINRVKPYNPIGRNQTEEESVQIGHNIKNKLIDLAIPFNEIEGRKESIQKIIKDIKENACDNSWFQKAKK